MIAGYDWEEWRPVPEYESYYEVSSKGNVRSVARWIKNGDNSYMWRQSKVLSPRYNKGYARVSLCVDRVAKDHFIHQLVAKAFIPNPNGFNVVHHKDNDRLNNNAYNLEWTTAANNIKIGWAQGRMYTPYLKGSQMGTAKLHESDVVDIRKRASFGELTKEIANFYKISESNCRAIIRKDSWRHV